MALGRQAGSVLASHVGGGSFVYRLKKLKGWTGEEVARRARNMVENEREKVNAFAGGALDEVPPEWRNDIAYLTALRLMVEEEGAFYELDDHPRDRVQEAPDEEVMPRREPVQSWYDTDDDFDDLEGYFE